MDELNQNIAVLEDQVSHNETKALWVFGYGSLCWMPGFDFHKAVTGYIQGYKRRFWQGNATHRGTEEKPGRVATLIEDHKGLVHGVAFAISGEAAIPYLSKRECKLGGYTSQFTTFYPDHGEPFKALLYIATPANRLWLGDGDVKDVATQIVECSGPSGHNVEYLLRLAQFMRQTFPDQDDDHLFGLELEVMKLIEARNMCMKSLMGNGDGCINFVKGQSRTASPQPQEDPERPSSFEHTTRVPEKMLRCLNI